MADVDKSKSSSSRKSSSKSKSSKSGRSSKSSSKSSGKSSRNISSSSKSGRSSKSSSKSSGKKSSRSKSSKSNSSSGKKRPSKQSDDIHDDFEIGKELGRGAFSIVYLATEKPSKDKYAVKVIDKKSVGQDMARLETEIEILKTVKHPNIIALYALYDTKDFFYIVTELVTGGELFDKIVEIGNYTEADAAKLVHKMLSAIDYLHNMGIVHRDLKPENLLLKDDTSMDEVKLADFGLSKIVGQAVMMQTACGTPGYVAPEVLKAQGYGPEVDLWSIGVITYILLCGFPPFYHEEMPELFEQIMNADYSFPEEYWNSVSDEAKDFISRLLVIDPEKRLNTKAALEHKWLAGNAPNKQLRSSFKEKFSKYVKVRKTESKVLTEELKV